MKKYLSWSSFRTSKTYVLILGLAATVWFLVRVIPKPSRAKYPCMQAAAPLMSSFIIYILGISASMFSYKKFRLAYGNSRYWMGTFFLLASVFSFGFVFVNESKESIAKAVRVSDTSFPVESNAPIGEAKGLFPGRVVWMHDADATNEYFEPEKGSGDWFYTANNSNHEVIQTMLAEAIKQYAGSDNSSSAWNAIFKSYNKSAGNGELGYASGERIAIKTNFTNSCCSPEESRMDNTPQLIWALLYELTVNAGVPQNMITIGDPYRQFQTKYLDLIYTDFPEVNYVDGSGSGNVSQTVPTSESVLFFAGADKDGVMHESTLPTHYIEAKYFINMPCLKTHNDGGITLIAKNHQGSYLKVGEDPKSQYAIDMHYSLPANTSGDGKYRHVVDYMGHKDTGGKGLLYIIDGLWGGESWQGFITKYKSAPFNNDYPNSIFIGQDPVALESVCFDVLFNENVVDDSKQKYPVELKLEIADGLKQMASSDYWPEGITYDPENDGIPLESLGVFEHWNNSVERKYSRNLGTGEGIELVYYNVQIENDPTIRCNITTDEMVIDGKADEPGWADAKWNAIDQVWIPYGNEMDEGDFEGKFKVLWDENYLYMLVEVVDDSLSDDFADPLKNWWDDDCLEIFIDENQSKGNHECNNNAFAYHVSLSYDAVDLGPDCKGINYKEHIDVKMDTIGDNTYLWELAFKIYDDTYDQSAGNEAESRVTLTPGKAMGLTVAYCDNDETGGRENFIGSVWVPAANFNDMYKNADLFGEMILIDPANPNTVPEINEQKFYIDENPEANALIGTVEASDADGNSLSYSIVQTSVEGAVNIDATSGELSVNDETLFDHETHTKIDIKVEVSDGIAKSSADIIIYIVDVNEVGLEQNQSVNFVVYPNPGNGEFSIKNKSNAIIHKIELYNNAGQLVSMERIEENSQESLKVNYQNVGKGAYYLKIYSDKTVVVKPVNIQ